MPPSDPTLEARKERAWRDVAAIDAALDRGEMDEATWHARMQRLIVPAYTSATNPRAQSGFRGDEVRWERARRFVLDAVDHDGTFLDIGCANGYLMECLATWAVADGIALEPYGVELSPELVDLARARLPAWTDRIFSGNALTWTPPFRFDFVRTGLEYVPARRRADLVRHLLAAATKPGGRLIIGAWTEEVANPKTESDLAAWGFPVSGRSEVPHPDDARLVRRVLWIDAPCRS